jgi:(5-formylfuran-3-yl)methyl phosphate synthase
MQLLVSVRSPAEATDAVAGNADIIDAKEPSLGSLGPVPASALSAIFDRVPERCPISIALGDVASDRDVVERIAAIPTRRPAYLKLGFAGLARAEVICNLLKTARTAAGEVFPARIVAVAYADATLAGSAAPPAICQAAADAGVAGILFDTYSKNGGDLLSWISLDELAELLARARAGGLATAVAGKLHVGHLEALHRAGPDVVGFRGALCIGGREGRLSRGRVRRAHQALRSQTSSEFLQGIG